MFNNKIMKEDHEITDEDKMFIPILRLRYAEILAVMQQLQTAIAPYGRYKPAIDTAVMKFKEASEKFDEKIKQTEKPKSQPSFCVQNPPIVENPVIKINLKLAEVLDLLKKIKKEYKDPALKTTIKLIKELSHSKVFTGGYDLATVNRLVIPKLSNEFFMIDNNLKIIETSLIKNEELHKLIGFAIKNFSDAHWIFLDEKMKIQNQENQYNFMAPKRFTRPTGFKGMLDLLVIQMILMDLLVHLLMKKIK